MRNRVCPTLFPVKRGHILVSLQNSSLKFIILFRTQATLFGAKLLAISEE